jgi:regulator of protease activity HflC (stomatin/prohibitin superfamily)
MGGLEGFYFFEPHKRPWSNQSKLHSNNNYLYINLLRKQPMSYFLDDNGNLKPKLVIYAIIGLFITLIVIANLPFKVVGATERGLVFNMGAIQDKVLSQGFNFRIPFYQQIKVITIQPIQLDHKVEVGRDAAITKDNQSIGADLTIFYKYNQNDLVRMYKDYGVDNLKSIILSTLRESFKGTIGEYDIFTLPTIQDEIRGKVLVKIREKMSSYPIEITELKIVNYDWSDEFDKQIQQTMERAQQVKQKEQELLIAEQEAQKKVKQATADKEAMITIAEGQKEAAALNADAKALEGEGIKKYNVSVQANMELEIRLRQLEIEKARVDKWDGHYVSTNNYSPIPISNSALLGQ